MRRELAVRATTSVVIAAAIALTCTASAQAQVEPKLLPDSVVQERLDSLMRLAVDASDQDERTRVVLRIAMVGVHSYLAHQQDSALEPEVRYPGVVERLDRIYDALPDPGLKDLIVRWMPWQAERCEAARFLSGVARAESPGVGPTGNPLPVAAVHFLDAMGSVRQEELRRLRAASDVKDPLARQAIEQLTRGGGQNRRPD